MMLTAFMMVVMVMSYDVGDIFPNLALDVRWKLHKFVFFVVLVLVHDDCF